MERVLWDACLNLGHNEVLQFAKEATITRRDIFKASRFRFKSTFAPYGQTSSVSDFVELYVMGVKLKIKMRLNINHALICCS